MAYTAFLGLSIERVLYVSKLQESTMKRLCQPCPPTVQVTLSVEMTEIIQKYNKSPETETGRECSSGLSPNLQRGRRRAPFLDLVPVGRASHGGMLLDTMLRRNDFGGQGGVAAMGAPGQEVSSDLDVIVRELAVLIVVHAEQLGLLRGAQLETGDEIDRFGYYGRHDKGVGACGDDGGNLPAENGEFSVEAASGARVDAIEADDLAGGEEGVEDEADDAAYAVLGEDVERVIDADQKFYCERGGVR